MGTHTLLSLPFLPMIGYFALAYQYGVILSDHHVGAVHVVLNSPDDVSNCSPLRETLFLESPLHSLWA